MTELSPTAQAVVTAIEKFDWEAGHFSREDIWLLLSIRAEILAIADELEAQ